MTSGPRSPVDAREVRFEQGVIAVALLAGFVFRVGWVLPGAALLVALGLAPGLPFRPLRWVYDRLVAPRVRVPDVIDLTTADDPPADRRDDLAALAVLTVASLVLAVGLNLVAWVIGLLQAAAAAVRATTGIPVVASLTQRFRP